MKRCTGLLFMRCMTSNRICRCFAFQIGKSSNQNDIIRHFQFRKCLPAYSNGVCRILRAILIDVGQVIRYDKSTISASIRCGFQKILYFSRFGSISGSSVKVKRVSLQLMQKIPKRVVISRRVQSRLSDPVHRSADLCMDRFQIWKGVESLLVRFDFCRRDSEGNGFFCTCNCISDCRNVSVSFPCHGSGGRQADGCDRWIPWTYGWILCDNPWLSYRSCLKSVENEAIRRGGRTASISAGLHRNNDTNRSDPAV